MKYEEMSPYAISQELGSRLKQARLNLNITQQEVADRAGLERKAIVNAEKGQTTLINLVSILMVLGLTEKLDLFIPQVLVSPVQLLKLEGKKRRRARSSVPQDGGETEW